MPSAVETPSPVDPTLAPEPPIIPAVPVPETPHVPPMAPETSAVPEPNYHIVLWPEPPGPPLYVCLLCAARDASEAVIRAHLTTEHSVDPLPSAMAGNPPVLDPVLGIQPATRREGTPDA
jgi:hypothetical protein